MEYKTSLLRSQEPQTSLYSEPCETNPYFQSLSRNIYFNTILPSAPESESALLHD
jgi:hypothetical protein